ncbi:helix-turn-helix domain containing protein [Enterococcus sp. LJL120]
MKFWTTKEIEYIKKNALLAETNEVLNVAELAKKLNRSERAVAKKIYLLRKEGELPKVNRENAIDSHGRPWSKDEEKRLIAMRKRGATYQEIAEALNRTEKTCAAKGAKLITKGKLKSNRASWSHEDVEKLSANIKFDENGYVENYSELSNLLGKNYQQLTQKVTNLRKQGLITVGADKCKTSVKSKQAMDKFNNARFASYPKKKEKTVMETKETPAVSVDSREVTLILTTTIVNGYQTEQYFTKEGRLIAKKELTTPASN